MKKQIIKNKSHDSVPATTTLEQQTVTAGQRAINLIWERTQSQIAKATVYSGIAVNTTVVITLILLRKEINTAIIAIILAALASMNTTTGIIIGFYFSRTNHSAIGGIGPKASPSNTGTR